MARDDDMEREFSDLEAEIEAKVDSLFVEGESLREAAPSPEDDPWKELKEHFLTLEWEIDAEVLEKISREVQKLQARYTDHPLSILLGWMDQVTDRIRARGTEVDQESMGIFHQLKDGLLQLAEDPFQDPAQVVDPLRDQVLQFLGTEDEEAPTITIEAAEGEEDQLFAELDRAVDEALRMDEEEPLFEEAFAEEEPEAAEEQPPVLQETVVEGALDLMAEAGETQVVAGEEAPWQQDTQLEEERGVPVREEVREEVRKEVREEVRKEVREEVREEVRRVPSEAVEPVEASDLERVKASLVEALRVLQGRLEAFRGAEDPFGLTALYEDVSGKIQEFAETLLGAVGPLQEAVRAVEGLDLVSPAPEREPKPKPPEEPDAVQEEVLFVSVSNRILCIPMSCVRGVFRVPGKVSPQLIQEQEVSLKGKTVPLVPLWKKLGLGRAIYPFPSDEKRVVLVSSMAGETGLLVDRVLARQDVPLKPMDEERHQFKGRVIVEKEALVVNVEAL